MVAFLFLGFLIFTGWNQSFKDHYDSLRGVTPPPVAAEPTPLPTPISGAPVRQVTPFPQLAPLPTPKKDNSWMFQDTKMNKPHK